MQNNLVITRGNLGQLASFIGATALLIGLLGVVWQGGLTTLITAFLVLGAAGLVMWAVLTPQEFIAFVTGRQARRGTIAVFSVLLLIGVVTLTYILLERAVLTLDMTDARGFTLSEATMDVLDGVQQPIRITGFYSPELLAEREVDDQFFRLYSTATNDLISREYIDPIEQPAIASSFQALDGDVFLSYVNPDGSLDRSTTMYVPLVDRQERDMTQAISRLLAAGNFTVYFTEGLGERTPGDETGAGLARVNELLVANGFRTLPLNLPQLAAADRPIPLDASVLIIARPQQQFSQEIIDLLDEYLVRGGALFILADAAFSEAPFLAQDSAFNNYLWENWGLRMLDAVVVDEGLNSATPLDIISYAISNLPITASLDPASDVNSATYFRLARAIQVDEDPPVNNGAAIQTSPNSFGETNFDLLAASNEFNFDEGADIPGPLTTVAYATNTSTDAKIVLVGDSDFITSGQIDSPPGNAYFVTDALGWLTRFTETVSFAPQAATASQPLLFVSSQTLDRLNFIMLIIMPGITLALGAGIWYIRSRR
ncbi:MAG: hypothetical protein OHK0046_01420 [Anaerolineae bacterium]